MKMVLPKTNFIGVLRTVSVTYPAVMPVAEAMVEFVAALLAGKIAGHEHVSVDGTLIYTDRVREPGPTISKNGKPVELWWSGKHHHHGGNVQVFSASDVDLQRAAGPNPRCHRAAHPSADSARAHRLDL